MVKIKRKVEMTLPELIEWAWKNDVEGKTFYSNIDGGFVYFDIRQTLSIEHSIDKDETFTVEVEEELTENTVLPSVVVVRTQYFPNNGHSTNVAKINSKSIKQVIENQPNNSKFEYHSIYLMESERIGQLIWKDGELVGDE
ncbi:hypothetical protein 7F13_10 [uncultured Caudovirales phage]|uniref:Phage PVL protein n=1 Tax=uncultured Caudovirales phage TaxID=2100421 RepID=A0A2H4JEF0_9CAUD|nr:hypothetical protein 7F13_10 [uncultured Caudovirales phage]